MGISGLLPALKSIQTVKHLSEFSGKTVAIDAYAWLHRGVYSCATELATGKQTSKYVRYVMERIRILRQHNIEAYVVFDGGPLPAKQGTEVTRKQKREENLARGKALAAEGKHSQAREFYVKCVDVTPQMAFQVIKALRAETVKYIVAPYEADAQMAYLERTGYVDAIVTEDSDMLVFGCENVLFKLDTVANTVVSISRSDFASVTASGPDSHGISLVGWSDAQFRAMAILSGCDYLPSIPGIGLKTACSLLRRWKTVDQVVRMVAIEGKKSVPRGYLDSFKLAEKCFLHQRVYDPSLERLVHLTNVDEEWNAELDAHVGGHIEASLAKKIAMGNVDPITLLPMQDINPGFMLHASMKKELSFISYNQSEKGKGKSLNEPRSDGILMFFGPNANIPRTEKSPSKIPIIVKKNKMIVGRASGKRTLAHVMDEDMVAKRKKQTHDERLSNFFTPPTAKSQSRHKTSQTPAAGSSRLRDEKENVKIVTDLTANEDDFGSLIAQGEVDLQMTLDIEEVLTAQTVEQEDGYLSPTPSGSQDTEELSSPIRPQDTPKRLPSKTKSLDDLYFGVDAVSSPPLASPRRAQSLTPQPYPRKSDGRPLFQTASTLDDEIVAGPDLRNQLEDELDDDSDCTSFNDIDNAPDQGPTSCPSPSPLTSDGELVDLEDSVERDHTSRQKVVAAGWHASYDLKRSETNVTPAGRHRSVRQPLSRSHPYLVPAPKSAPPKYISKPPNKLGRGRTSLVFLNEPVSTSRDKITDGGYFETEVESERVEDTVGDMFQERANGRLDRFRYV